MGPVLPPVPTALGEMACRPREEDDAGVLLALLAAVRQAELDLTGWGGEQRRTFLELQLRAREQHRDATRPGAELSMVTLDGVTIGQLDLDRTDGVEILEVGLLAGFRGRGLGTALLEGVLAAADAAGEPVRLHVEHGNPARHLYERLGFGPAGETATHVALVRPPGASARPAGPPAVPAAPAGEGPYPVGATTSTPMEVGPEHVVGVMPSFADLSPHVGTMVEVLPGGPRLAVTAVDAIRAGGSAPPPFSVLFSGPLEHPLDQGLHRLQLPVVGVVDIFLVPLEPTAERAVYEAVFT